MAICSDKIIDQTAAVTGPGELRIALGLVAVEPYGSAFALVAVELRVVVTSAFRRVKLDPSVVLLDAGLYPDVRQVRLVVIEDADGSVIVDGELQVVAFDVLPVL